MTSHQFEYVYNKVCKHIKKLGYPVITRTEFKAYLGLMGINKHTEIDSKVLADDMKTKLTATFLNLVDETSNETHTEPLTEEKLEAMLSEAL